MLGMKKLTVLVLASPLASSALANINPLDVFNASHLENTANQGSNSVGEIESLPFETECVFYSSLFDDGHSLARVDVSVSGGDPKSWAATLVAVAFSAKETGADSIQVYLHNQAFDKSVEGIFRDIGVAYYQPTGKGIWSDEDGSKVLTVYSSQREKLLGKRDFDITNDFNKINQSLIDNGVEYDKADKIAGDKVAKKYHLKKDWLLPTGNYSSSSDEINVNDWKIDTSPSNDALNKIKYIYKEIQRPTYSSCE